MAELDLAPRAIYLKPSAWIVKSTAGKPARSATRDKLLAEHPELLLEVEHTWKKPKSRTTSSG